MKVTVELDCTPEEARKMLGLPDVNKLNEMYVKEMAKFLQGSKSLEQLQSFTKTVAPMGEAGLKMFSSFITGAMGSGSGSKKSTSSNASPKSSSSSKKKS